MYNVRISLDIFSQRRLQCQIILGHFCSTLFKICTDSLSRELINLTLLADSTASCAEKLDRSIASEAICNRRHLAVSKRSSTKIYFSQDTA